MAEYPDAEQLVIEFLRSQDGDVRCVSELPGSLEKVVPLWQVERIGGGDPEPGLDQATIDVESFAASRPAAISLAAQAHDLLRFQMPGYSGTGTVLRVETLSAPAWRPYGNTAVRRVGGTYRVTIHAH